jgi:K+-sensing histidine kinase KdpD
MDEVALWLTGGSLAVSVVSALLAWRAKEQAKKAVALEPRKKAIDHLRHALSDINTHGLVREETVSSIQDAMHLSALVFGRRVRKQLDQAYKTAFHLREPSERLTDQQHQDTHELAKKLRALIVRMNRETSLVG